MLQLILAVALFAQLPPSDAQVLDALPTKEAATNVSINKKLVDFPVDFTTGATMNRWSCVVSYTEVRGDERVPRLIVVYMETSQKGVQSTPATAAPSR